MNKKTAIDLEIEEVEDKLYRLRFRSEDGAPIPEETLLENSEYVHLTERLKKLSARSELAAKKEMKQKRKRHGGSKRTTGVYFDES